MALAPAANGAGDQERAGLRAARADGDDEAADVDIAHHGRRLVVTTRLQAAVAELAVKVPAPAAHRAGGQAGAGVLAAGADLRDGTADGDVTGRRGRLVVADVA